LSNGHDGASELRLPFGAPLGFGSINLKADEAMGRAAVAAAAAEGARYFVFFSVCEPAADDTFLRGWGCGGMVAATMDRRGKSHSRNGPH